MRIIFSYSKFSYIIYSLLICLLVGAKTNAQLLVDTSLTNEDIVNNFLLGPGVKAFNIQYNGKGVARGVFKSTSTNIGISNGILLTTGLATDAIGPNNSPDKSFNNGSPGDPDLDSIFNQQTVNAASLEFDFIPSSDTVKFNYVFASEEYTEGVCTIYNDLFGFYISGPVINGIKNLALIPGTNIPVSISSVNGGNIGSPIYNANVNNPGCFLSNSQFYIDNSIPAGMEIQYDGFTKVLQAKVGVIPCETYHIKIAIAEAYDPTFDSGVFIEGGSFNSQYVTISSQPELVGTIVDSSIVENCGKAIIHFKRYDSLSKRRVLAFKTTGSAQNLIDFTLNSDSIYFEVGIDTFNLELIPNYVNSNGTVKTSNIELLPDFVICEASDPPIVSVKMIDPIPFQVTSNNDTIVICGLYEIVLAAKGFGGYTNNYNYKWVWNNQEFLGDTITITPISNSVVSLFVTDSCKIFELFKQINIYCEAFIPNAFTPNGDGRNDYFELTNIYGADLKVYNRWGQLIYSKNIYDNSWDGYLIPNGVYAYSIKLLNNKILHGRVTLFR